MNGLFTGVFIYADDITLLAPSRASLAVMLEQCESFSRTHDILFNASKTKYMVFKRRELVHVNAAPLYFDGSPINCVHECDLLGITLSSNRSTDNVIEKAVMKFNIKSNEVFSDFKLLPCYINRNCLQLFVLMHTDVSYGISNLKKYIIFMSLGEKQYVNYGVYHILLTATCCIQLTTLSLLKYHWRREVLNQFGHV